METKCHDFYPMDKGQQQLIDLFAEAMKSENFPPLAGKILGLFYTSEKKYLTFEEIKNTIGASKGAVSKSMAFIQNLGIIKFTSIEGIKRRRHFYIDVESNKQYIYRLEKYFKLQTELYMKVLEQRGNTNPELNRFLEDLVELNKQFLVVADHIKTGFR